MRQLLTFALALTAALPATAQDAIDFDWWSNRTSVQNVETVSFGGQGEYLRLANATSGFLEGEITFPAPFFTQREYVYGVRAAAGDMPVGERVRVFFEDGLITEFSGLTNNQTDFDTFTGWGIAGNSATIRYRIEFESPSAVASDHAVFLRGRAVGRRADVVLGEPGCALSPNSVGPGAFLLALGSNSVAQNDFRLVATAVRPVTSGLFIYAPDSAQVPFGDGFLCLSGGIQRLVPSALSNLSGEMERHVDFTTAPAGVGPTKITGGSTWSFQLWYRDGATFNLSESLRVSFTP